MTKIIAQSTPDANITRVGSVQFESGKLQSEGETSEEVSDLISETNELMTWDSAAPPDGVDAPVSERLADMDADRSMSELRNVLYREGYLLLDEEQFEDISTASLGSFSAGDIVDTPDGVGVVTEILTESWENDTDADDVPDKIDASEDSPVYAVVIEDESKGVGFYKAEELSTAEIETDVDPMETFEDDEAAAAACAGCDDDEAALRWSPPKSWRESDTPARLIAMRAFASMGAEHGGDDGRGCVGTMKGKVSNPDRYCAGFIDYVYGGYTYWRGDSFLPGA